VLPLTGELPQYWFPWGGGIAIEPLPAAAHTLNVYTVGYPACAMTEEADEPLIGRQYHELIPLRAAFTALLKDDDYGKAGLAYVLAARGLQAARRLTGEPRADTAAALLIPARTTTTRRQER
jgi:hypothetical protein